MGCCLNSLGQVRRSENKIKKPIKTNIFIFVNVRKKGLFKVAEVGSSQEYSMGSGAFQKLPK